MLNVNLQVPNRYQNGRIRIEIFLLGICYKNGFIEMVESLVVTVLLLVGCIRSQRFLVLFMR